VKIAPVAGRPGELEISGDIDYHSSEQLHRRLAAALDEHGGSITLHLDRVEFIDSSGLSVLLDAVKTARARGGRITLVRPSRQLTRVLGVSGFAPFFEMRDGDTAAVPASGQQRGTDDGIRTATFEAEGRPENIAALRRSVVKFAEGLPLTEQELDDVKLAVGEATCNALRYGCPTGSETIHVTCTREGNRFSVRVTDPGPGFDPESIPQVREGELAEGGRGIFFMRCLMDEVNFHFSGGTTVELVKYLPEPLEEGGGI
jgi:anti-anti-sigma factor